MTFTSSDLCLYTHLNELAKVFIYQYENIGSFTEPSFRFVTNDYANFSALGFYNIKIQFEDFDKDGHADVRDFVYITETVFHQNIHRYEEIGLPSDVWQACKRGIENECAR